MSNTELEDLERQLAELDSQRAGLILKVNTLRNSIASGAASRELPPILGRPVLLKPPGTNPEKVALFLKLFRCREDLYPKRWENPKSGKQGYAPACQNEWVKPICKKPEIKCGECSHQEFFPLEEGVVESHLKGSVTIGT